MFLSKWIHPQVNQTNSHGVRNPPIQARQTISFNYVVGQQSVIFWLQHWDLCLNMILTKPVASFLASLIGNVRC